MVGAVRSVYPLVMEVVVGVVVKGYGSPPTLLAECCNGAQYVEYCPLTRISGSVVGSSPRFILAVTHTLKVMHLTAGTYDHILCRVFLPPDMGWSTSTLALLTTVGA